MKKQSLLTLLISMVMLTSLHAGDAADFVNLGFSSDGRYMMFGQYGFSVDKNETYASIFTIDVAQNSFVRGGLFNLVNKDWIEPGDSANGALFTLIENAAATRRQYSVDYLKKGRLLYIASTLNDQANMADSLPARGSTLAFRDYQTAVDYSISLEQAVAGQGANVESTFSILVTMKNDAGESKTFRVGHPNFKRKGVSNYSIERVILAPGGKALVFAVAREEYSGNGSPNIRYMVETAPIN